MLDISQEICAKFKAARQAKGLNQSALAQIVGCRQSAISMFEGGLTTKLSEETVKKLSEFLKVPLEAEKKEQIPSEILPSVAIGQMIRGFCPDCNCLSNVPYMVGSRMFFRPSRLVSSPTGGKYCAICGELLELRCPVCGAQLNDGACCAACGSTYVTPVLPDGIDLMEYVRNRRIDIESMRKF